MTSRNKKKSTLTSSKLATPTNKKDQATLPDTWTKKDKTFPLQGPNPVTPAVLTDPEITTVPMMENMPSATDATDTASYAQCSSAQIPSSYDTTSQLPIQTPQRCQRYAPGSLFHASSTCDKTQSSAIIDLSNETTGKQSDGGS
jgi:hypothetical protein